MISRKVIFPVSGALIAAVILGIFYLNWVGTPPGKGREIVFIVENGWGARKVCRALADSGLVRSSLYTLWRYEKLETVFPLQAGTYLLYDTMPPDSILMMIITGDVIPVPTHWLTLPPGLTIEQSLDRIASDLEIDREALDSLSRDHSFAGVPGITCLEGYLYPETYEFADTLSIEEILTRVVSAGQALWTPEWDMALESTGLTRHETVILASIVEREARIDSERAVIAGVFLGRLRRGMKLESCATVQYVLGEVREQLLYRDLDIDDPYNTYLYVGLPPGPICSPSVASLEAAVFPDTAEGYLYFVSRDDGSGGHLFAKTHAGHQANRRNIRSGLTD